MEKAIHKLRGRILQLIVPVSSQENRYFKEMKALLYAAVEQAPSAELVEPEILTRYFAKFDEQFFSYCDKELTKINTFYSGTRAGPFNHVLIYMCFLQRN